MFSLPYINANYIEKGSLSPEDKTAIEDLKQGRPFKLKIGDIVNDTDGLRACITQKNFSMYQEPKSTSKKIVLPKGSKVCYPLETEGVDPGTYIDMEDNLWPPIIDANSKKILGWRSNIDDSDNNFWSVLGMPM
jgi:hypothetical protein